MGSWPAIWTLGISGRWPLGGEIDIMEFYRSEDIPTLLANVAWGSGKDGRPIWNTGKIPLSHFTKNNRDWSKQFHVWRMDWTKDSINLYLDDELLNTQLISKTVNPDGSNPFLKPQYLLLNLAIGANGGNPSKTTFPIRFEVDYVRVYELNPER
jgi:beta-glucanase (GH16 family)